MGGERESSEGLGGETVRGDVREDRILGLMKLLRAIFLKYSDLNNFLFTFVLQVNKLCSRDFMILPSLGEL